MLKNGTIVLSVWCFLNALPGCFSLVILALGKHAPGLRMLFTEDEITRIEPKALATIDGLALIANTLISVVCLLILCIALKCLRAGQRWALHVLLAACASLQIASYLSDALYFRGQNLLAVNVSSAVLLVAFCLCAAGISDRKLWKGKA